MMKRSKWLIGAATTAFVLSGMTGAWARPGGDGGPRGERPRGDQPRGERPRGERPRDGQQNTRPQNGGQSDGVRPSRPQQSGGQSDGVRPNRPQQSGAQGSSAPQGGTQGGTQRGTERGRGDGGRRNPNANSAQQFLGDAQALTGRALTPAQQQQLLGAVTTRNTAVQAAQDRFRDGVRAIVGDNTDQSQLTDAQRQQLRDLATTRNTEIRAAQDTFRQNAATTLGQPVNQLNAGVEALNTGRQIERVTGRPVSETQRSALGAAISTRNTAVQAAQDQFRQSAQAITGTTNRAQLTDAQRQQLRDLATARDRAIRDAQNTFRQRAAAGVGMSAQALDACLNGTMRPADAAPLGTPSQAVTSDGGDVVQY